MNEVFKMNALELISKSIITDSALGFEPEIEVTHKWDLLPRFKKAGFTYVGLAIAGEFTSLDETMHYMSRHRARIAAHPNEYIIAKTASDILRAKQENKLALGFWLQGSNPLGNDINMVQTYYDLGVRYILLCYNTRNAMGDGCIEPNDAGLSQFGIKVVEEMNRIGMLVDASHTGFRTTMDILNLSKDPIIFSHSNVNSLVPHPRNVKDEALLALAKNGGVINLSGLAMMLGQEKSSMTAYVNHISYIADLIGPEHIGIGLDMVYFHEVLDLFFTKAGITTYPKNYVKSMDSAKPEDVMELTEILIQRGFSEKDIKGILGENYLRVVTQVWK